MDGQILGTPAYMSPEQAEGRRADARTDVYSLGIVLYELLTGQRPFRGNVQSVLHQVINAKPSSPMSANREVPPDLEKICLKCLCKVPGDRYSSAGDFRDDLDRFLQGLPVRARPIPAAARGWRWTRRHPKTAVLIVAVVVLSLCLPIVLAVHENEVAKAKRKLDEERESARLNAEANRSRLQKLYIAKGNKRIEAGSPLQALPWFSAALAAFPRVPHQTRCTARGW